MYLTLHMYTSLCLLSNSNSHASSMFHVVGLCSDITWEAQTDCYRHLHVIGCGLTLSNVLFRIPVRSAHRLVRIDPVRFEDALTDFSPMLLFRPCMPVPCISNLLLQVLLL